MTATETDTVPPTGSPTGTETSGTCTTTPTGTASIPTIQAGQVETITASACFTPGETVDGALHSAAVALGQVSADALGNVRFTFTVPADTVPGPHTVSLTGETSGAVVNTPITVVGGSAPQTTSTVPLATTGSPYLGQSALGLALILGGIVLCGGAWFFGSRQRRPRHHRI